MRSIRRDGRTPILYLAPWVDFGGTDKGTIDWFRWLDRGRYAPSLVTTQPSENRRLGEVVPYAEEVWALPDLMAGSEMPWFIFDFIHTREVEVLHVMNSRLGYELLPDLACLARPPKVVVQLHVEEPDRSGYVRYVTTRYGNIVDSFSVTSEHLAEAVHGYGISRDRIEVIYTGVDAEDEFSPGRAEPISGLAPDMVHVLYPGRLVEQKDPLLMVEVATLLRDRGLEFQIHAVGEGDLEADVRALVEARGLGRHVLVHPATTRLQGWYAACDLLLMTSVFEGVPYVVYEAMAMGLPVVGPALPGNVELLGDLAGGLIEPRDDAQAYAEALAALIEDPGSRDELAERARERVRDRFSLQRMGDEHTQLYDELLEQTVADPTAAAGDAAESLPPLRFSRQLHEVPLVSVIVPCFNHGRFLGECLDAIRAQTHPRLEVVVVDDASTESETVAALEALEREGGATVLRLPENVGPSAARNRALDRCSGRYVLPVDADNLLLPDAVERLVEQLKTAHEEVGFIYPNLRFFGNREDYFEAPDWNFHGLLLRNYCDVCSLFDREIFDAGERFDESIRLGHEDWEFVLRLAGRGVRGEPAHMPTVRYRKAGFNRSDTVEYAGTAFHERIRELSPLYTFEAEIKSSWSPALSLVALAPVDAAAEEGVRLARRLVDQSCIDVELIVRYEGRWHAPRDVPPVRRLPPALADSPGAALADALTIARGRIVAVASGTGSQLLADPAFVEKVLRIAGPQEGAERPDALVLASSREQGAPALRLIDDATGHLGAPHAIVFGPECLELLPDPLVVDADAPVESLVRAAVAGGLWVQWRHVAVPPRPDPGDLGDRATGGQLVLPRPGVRPRRGGQEAHRWGLQPPLLPALPAAVPRWIAGATWTPPQSTTLCRHRESGGDRRVVTIDREPPPGFELEYDLGCVRVFSLPGTARLVGTADGYATEPLGSWRPDSSVERHLGYVELAAFPLLEPLILGTHVPTGERVLVCGHTDPLLPEVEPVETLGFLESYPVGPRFRPDARRVVGLVGLTKAVDRRARRHRYAVGAVAEGDLVGELGALLEAPPPGAVPAWLVDDKVVTDRHRPPAAGGIDRGVLGRWTLAPLSWRGFSSPLPKARAVGRRALVSVGAVARRNGGLAEAGEAPSGWLLAEPLAGTLPLYAAYHPVTGDQALTTNPLEATDMGYRHQELLGYLRAAAPVTDSLEQRVVPVPWAARFGLEARR